MSSAGNRFGRRTSASLLSHSDFCFATTGDGSIALRPDWKRMLALAGEMPTLCIQVRNAAARLSVRLSVDEGREWMDLSSLIWTPGEGCSAWARLEICKCCGSPGYLCVFDPSGAEYLRFSPPAEIGLQGWARFLAEFATRTVTNADSGTGGVPQGAVLPEGARRVDLAPSALNRILHHVGMSHERLIASVRTAGASLVRDFVITRMECDDASLTLRGENTGFVLDASCVRSLATVPEEGDDRLLLLGADSSILAEFGPAEDTVSQVVWQSALRKVHGVRHQ